MLMAKKQPAPEGEVGNFECFPPTRYLLLSKIILSGYTSDDSKVSRIGCGDATRRQNGARRVDVQDDRLVGARNLHAGRDHIRRYILSGVWILKTKNDFSRTQVFCYVHTACVG